MDACMGHLCVGNMGVYIGAFMYVSVMGTYIPCIEHLYVCILYCVCLFTIVCIYRLFMGTCIITMFTCDIK